MYYIRCIILLLLIPCYQGCNADAGSMFTLMNSTEKINPTIFISSQITEADRASLNIFKSAFQKSTGVSLNVENEQTSKKQIGSSIYFGNTNAAKKLKLQSLNKDGYQILQHDESVYIVSETTLGLQYAVYDFIETYLNGFKPDEGEILHAKNTFVNIPSNLTKVENPAFEFRQAYFPASNNIEYQQWHRTQHLEKSWGCWGHHLGDLIKKNNTRIPANCFAFINGVRNEEQFCFSSETLHQQIKLAIQHEMNSGNTATKWMIAANDNAFVCQCEQCNSINSRNSASNAVVQLMNKLASDFPLLQISTLAYATTYQAPTKSRLASNCMVMLSTIDIPKGIAIEDQSANTSFNQWVQEWKQVCNNLYVWDYAIQYTNYFDVFPNLPALQKDLQYFKKLGINGVFEQGTEYQYGLFEEWKCYAISKLLWNPNIDLKSIRSNFFTKFYGPSGKVIEEFYSLCEQNLIKRKAILDIYGNVQLASKAYLDYNALASILTTLRKVISVEDTKQPRIYYNVHKLQTCLELLMLQYQRWKGIDEEGIAEAIDETSWTIKPGLIEKITKLKKACIDDEIETMNENGELVQTYLSNYEKFLSSYETKNLLWKKPVTYHSTADDSYPANGKLTLVDGMNGTDDYSFNWQLFNNTSMDISLESISVSSANSLSIRFLNDPSHYIFLPKAIHVYAGASANDAIKIKTFLPVENKTMRASIITYNLKADQTLRNATFIRIVAEGLGELPEWKTHPTKKPTIACDEINIQ